MNRKGATESQGQELQLRTHRIRLPGFLIEEETGLGDTIKRATYAMGIKPCGGCEKRAAALNQWMHFSRSSTL
jgi:hypothetical protein